MEFLNIGVSTVKDGQNGKYTEQEIMEVLRTYRRLGVRAIEFSHVFHMTDESAERIGKYCLSIGMVPWSVHLRGISPNPDSRFTSLKFDLRMAEKLGVQVAVIHGIGMKPDGTHYIDEYREAADIAASHGLKLAFETGTCADITNSGKTDHQGMIDLVDALDRPNAGINIDTGHTNLRDTVPVQEVVRNVGDRLITLHCQDNFGLRDDHQSPGLGHINWYEVLKALKESSYNGPFLMELTDCAKEKRAIADFGGYIMSIEQEVASATAWIKYLWKQIECK